MKKKQIGTGLFIFILLLSLIPIAKFAFFKKEKETSVAKVENLHEAKFWKVLAGGRVQ